MMTDAELENLEEQLRELACASGHGELGAADALAALRQERDGAERQVATLRNLVRTLIDNDPDEPISDAGHTVIDLWRHEARAALAETEKKR